MLVINKLIVKHMRSLKELSLNIPDQEYHDLDCWSYSAIARYAREGFSSLYKLQEKTAPTAAMEFGSLFDTIITKGKKVYDEYACCSVTVPDAEKNAIDYIVTKTDAQFDELSSEFISSCCDACGYQMRWGAEARYKHISPYREYYDIKKSGKKIVSKEDMDDALEMAREFYADKYVRSIFGTKNGNGMEYIYQAQFVTDMDVNGRTVKVKIMPDLIVVNHNEKTIRPVDLKTSAMPAYDFPSNFLKYRYDIQASLYTDVLCKLIRSEAVEYADYTMLPYIFADISRVDKVPVCYEYDPHADSQLDGLSFTRGDGEKVISYKNWRTLLTEILDYQESQAVVPSYIKTNESNDLLDILSTR